MTDEERDAPGWIYPGAFDDPKRVARVLKGVTRAVLTTTDNGTPVLLYWP